jgi:hypothetical protein
MTRKFRVGEIVKANKSVRKRFVNSALICRIVGKLGKITSTYSNFNDRHIYYRVVFNKFSGDYFVFYRNEISHISKSRKDEFIAERVAEQL